MPEALPLKSQAFREKFILGFTYLQDPGHSVGLDRGKFTWGFTYKMVLSFIWVILQKCPQLLKLFFFPVSILIKSLSNDFECFHISYLGK